MSKPYYTSFHRRGDKVYIREITEDGGRNNYKVDYKPKLYLPTSDISEYKTLEGRNLQEVQFSSISAARDYADAYTQTGNTIYGFNRWEYACINELYPYEIEYDLNQIRIGILDIETESIGHFSSIETPDQPITLIQFIFNKVIYVFGTDFYESYRDDVKFIRCKDEEDMLRKFCAFFKKVDIDILTDWNGSGYDLPMLWSRMRFLNMESLFKSLSPFNQIDVYETEVFKKSQIRVDLEGIQHLDYMNLIRKFDQRRFVNYKLDTVSKAITGKGKVKYQGSLGELRITDYQKFVEYGIRDVESLMEIDESVNMIEMLIMLGYKSKTNYEDAFYQVRMWDCTFYDYLKNNRKVQVPYKAYESEYIVDDADDEDGYEGAYVKPIRLGKYRWVVSDDVQSLYPSIIMAWNMSPETYRGTFSKDVEYFLSQYDTDTEMHDKLREQNVSIVGNGSTFDRKRIGFIPQILDEEFNARVRAKEQAKIAKKEMEKIKDILKRRGVSL